MDKVTKRWLRYWRNSLADTESGRGGLGKNEFKALSRVDKDTFRDGHLPFGHWALTKLFEGEPEQVQVVRAVLRPVVYRARKEHGREKTALLPEVVTPLTCVLWVGRNGQFVPAEPPVIPRDLLHPQGDDRFTLSEVEAQDRFLTKADPSVYSEQEAQRLLKTESRENLAKRWTAYYDVSRDLFATLVSLPQLDDALDEDEKACLSKLDRRQTGGAGKQVLDLYDWLSGQDEQLPLLDRYALAQLEAPRPCLDALSKLDDRLGHPNADYPLADAQRDALAQVLAMADGEILAVNGPPGTGKTTFVLAVVASLWVEAALDEGEPPLVVAASTNNQAVTNILAAFARDFGYNGGSWDGRWLPGVDSYGGFYPAPSREDESAKHYQTGDFYRRLEQPECLEAHEEQFLARARVAFGDHSIERVADVRKRLHSTLVETRERLVAIQTCFQHMAELQAWLGDAPEEDLKRDQTSLDELAEALVIVETDARGWKQFRADESLWLALLGILPPVARKRRLRRELHMERTFDQRTRFIIDQANADQPPEAALDDWIVCQKARVAECERRIDERKEKLKAHADARSSLRKALPDPACGDSPNDVDKSLDTTLRFTLFQLAVHYWEARWLEDCRAQARQLSAKGQKKMGLKSVRPRWRRRMKLTPCIVSTLHSLPGHMTHKPFDGKDEQGNNQFRTDYLVREIDLLIIDEAGQVAPEVAGASFALASKALVIGDEHQIPPVPRQISAVDVGNLHHHQLLADRDEYEAIQDTGRSVVKGSAMRVAQVASCHHHQPEAEPGMFLREHRRCLNPIIDYCNTLCYQGLLLPMRDKPARDPELPPFGYIHVDGRTERPPSGSRVNLLEAETVAAWLAAHRAELEEKHAPETLGEIVGVVTPFKAQALEIIEACRDRGLPVEQDEHAVTVGTVHALQGAERPVVLFSAVYSRHADGGFIDRDPSMLNVAVSRAKDSFLVFGDMEVMDTAAPGTPRGLLSRYLRKREENQLSFSIDKARPDLLERCRQPQVITNAEQHDACIRDVLENPSVQTRVVLVSPWIVLERMQQTGLLDVLGRAAARGLDVIIYTDHHFNTTTGNRPDVAKSERFDACCKALGTQGVTVKVVNNVHSKLVMADERFLCVGSFNWGSALRTGAYRNMETSVLYSGNLAEEINLQIALLEQRVREIHEAAPAPIAD